MFIEFNGDLINLSHVSKIEKTEDEDKQCWLDIFINNDCIASESFDSEEERDHRFSEIREVFKKNNLMYNNKRVGK